MTKLQNVKRLWAKLFPKWINWIKKKRKNRTKRRRAVTSLFPCYDECVWHRGGRQVWLHSQILLDRTSPGIRTWSRLMRRTPGGDFTSLQTRASFNQNSATKWNSCLRNGTFGSHVGKMLTAQSWNVPLCFNFTHWVWMKLVCVCVCVRNDTLPRNYKNSSVTFDSLPPSQKRLKSTARSQATHLQLKGRDYSDIIHVQEQDSFKPRQLQIILRGITSRTCGTSKVTGE